MRKIIVSNYVTLDGFIAGPNGEIDWFVWDEEMAKYSGELLYSIDTLLFGRMTYELMASYWPVPQRCHTPPQTASGDNGRNGQTDKRFYIF
jgi:dihydrofolate reductase